MGINSNYWGISMVGINSNGCWGISIVVGMVYNNWVGIVSSIMSINVGVGVGSMGGYMSVSQMTQWISSISIVGVGTFSNGDGGHHDYNCNAL